MKLVFVHGWGFDASVWRDVRAGLPEFDCDSVDLGFFGKPRAAQPNGEDVIAVGHSLGFLWLLHERPFPWRALVSVSGMPRFTKAPDYRFGVDARLLEATRTRFAQAPAETLADFLTRCGATGVNGSRADVTRLDEGLVWLKEWDARATLDAEAAPLLALYAEDDAIVPKDLSENIFGGRAKTARAVAADGGHALPVNRAGWCAARIREFARALT